MDIVDHLQRIQKRISAFQGLASVDNCIAQVLSTPDNRADIRARLIFFDGSFLEFHEIVETGKCFPQLLKYEYQYIYLDQRVFRYDMSEHHPEIKTHPHHKHIGLGENQIIESKQPNYDEVNVEVLNYIIQRINRNRPTD